MIDWEAVLDRTYKPAIVLGKYVLQKVPQFRHFGGNGVWYITIIQVQALPYKTLRRVLCGQLSPSFAFTTY